MIPEATVAEVRARTDLVALVGEYVRLKRMGTGASYRGLCPFHAEKTPSFYVHPARGFFHCFGCGASGDAISFLMKLEGRAFPDCVRSLAEKAGIAIEEANPEQVSEERRVRARKDRLYAALDYAAGFYVDQLQTHLDASAARAELEKRGVRDEAAAKFRLGYAPDSWDALATYLEKQGVDPNDAQEVGLIGRRKSGSGHYDRFRHRLMFPITDIAGKIVGFSGRVLPLPAGRDAPEEAPAKYINSPESPVYHKGDVLFGLFEGRVAARREGWLFLCEGNFDLVALHQAGFENAAAPLGTAFTREQARLIKRFAERVVLLFDPDNAGRKAVRAAFPLLREVGLSASVITLPAGHDPDSFLRDRGGDSLRALVSNAPGIVEALIDDAAERTRGDAAERARAIEELGPIVYATDNPVEGRLYIERVGRKFGISDLEAVRKQLLRGRRGEKTPDLRRRERDRGPLPPGSAEGAAPADGSAAEPVDPAFDAPIPPDEATIVGALLDAPELLGIPERSRLEELLTSPVLRVIVRLAAEGVGDGRGLDAALLLARVPRGAGKAWLEERLSVEKFNADTAKTALKDGLASLERRARERELRRMMDDALAAMRAGETEKSLAIMAERDRLLREERT